jgi:thiamine-monophosphate kinase
MAAHMDKQWNWTCAVAGGDDYELCFTLAPEKQALLETLPFPCFCIGEIVSGTDLQLIRADGSILPPIKSWEHFST